jgi:hypothetical protein
MLKSLQGSESILFFTSRCPDWQSLQSVASGTRTFKLASLINYKQQGGLGLPEGNSLAGSSP